MVNNDLKDKFNENAANYDALRKLIIPCFDDLYEITRDLANTDKKSPKILDLGAGTGLLTMYLFEKFPDAEFTLVDISEEMLKIAKNRFNNYNNFKYIVADYSNHEFNSKFDIVVSSLSIHHLEDFDKEKLYKNVYESLNTDGIFLNADQIIGNTPEIDDSYQKNWIAKINANLPDENEKKLIIERMKFDKPATLQNNLNWLINCGFKDIDVYYKYYNFCIFYGKK